MANLIAAECPCGFKAERLFLGSGLCTPYRATFPCYCRRCKTLSVLDLAFKAPAVLREKTGNKWLKVPVETLVCPECYSTNVVPYDSSKVEGEKGDEQVFRASTANDLGRDLILTNGNYLCPSCQQYSLTFTAIGHWD